MPNAAKVLKLVNILIVSLLVAYLLTKVSWTSSSSLSSSSRLVAFERPLVSSEFNVFDDVFSKRNLSNADLKDDGPIANLSSRNSKNHGNESSALGRECRNPFYKLAFVKTHKCASDTIAAHFMRLVENHNLEMPLPTGPWNLNWPNYPGHFYKSRKASKRFDMQMLHMMYYPSVWDQLMEPGYKLISVVRQPFHQFKSFFNYFGLSKKLSEFNGIPVDKTLDEFLTHPQQFYQVFAKPFWKNSMLFDFGFRNGVDNPETFVRNLAKRFSFVMVSDYFDESMIVLRHQFCLPFKDILMRIKNVSKKYAFGPKTTEDEEEEQRREEKYKRWAGGDYLLFHTFNASLWEKIAKIPNFAEQLADYRSTSATVNQYCDMRRFRRTTVDLVIAANKFHEAVVIDKLFCEQIMLGVIRYIERLKNQRYSSKSPAYGRKFVLER